MDLETPETTKNNRLRGRKKKSLYLKIRAQMEFYFSDSNLAKDRFVQKLVEDSADGYVELEVFKTFNKIKSFTEDVEIIAAAVSKSDKLELNETKTKIRRIAPLGKSKDFDACTAYVEKLPSYADHKWIKDVFEHFGTVDYITIPRFKTSNKIKGFAFIEFNEPESVTKACEYYRNLLIKEASKLEESAESKGERKKRSRNYSQSKDHGESFEHKGRKRTTSLNLETAQSREHGEHSEGKSRKRKASLDLEAISNKERGEDSERKHRKRKPSTKLERTAKKVRKENRSISMPESKSDCDKSDSDHVEKARGHKRKRKSMDDICDAPIKKEKEAWVVDSKPQLQSANQKEDSDAQIEQKHVPSADEANNTDVVEASESEETGAKSKRKKKHRKRHHSERPLLRVLSKSDWKIFRNKYLGLQRTTMSYLKKQILMEALEWKEKEASIKKEESPKKRFHIQTGVLIQITLKESITDPAAVKEKIKTSSPVPVAYVDAKLGYSELFIRCHNPEDAQSIIKSEKLNFMGLAKLLEGDEEEAYKKKVDEERKAKFSVPLHNKKRGRDKLIAKAMKLTEQKNNHIYFDA